MPELPSFLKDFIGPFPEKPNIIGRLPNKKPIILNPDGSFSTVYGTVVQDKNINAGKPTAIPTIFGGVFHSIPESIEIIKRNAGHDPDTRENLPAIAKDQESLSKKHGEVLRLMQMRKLLSLLGIERDLED